MNSFGTLFRVSIFGESHGEIVGVLIDGCPHGISLRNSDFTDDISRRKAGAKGTTSRNESDIPHIKSGVFNGKTTGAPILIEFENRDINSNDYEVFRTIPRPGHADFVANKKSGGDNDYRGGGHFSGRLTLALVAAGVVAKRIVPKVTFSSKITEIGGKSDWKVVLEQAIDQKDSLGGIIETTISHLPISLGEPFFDSVESLISHAVFAIPGVKGIEFGAGFSSAKMSGSKMNDAIISADGTTKTNNAGGINGGISNGNDIIFRVAIKPTASIGKPQQSFNLATEKLTELTLQGRHDAAFVLRVPVIIEAVSAIVSANLMMRAK
ncbi:chorismate synthase [bacterium]|nr:chorismate synthase [bacterium]